MRKIKHLKHIPKSKMQLLYIDLLRFSKMK